MLIPLFTKSSDPPPSRPEPWVKANQFFVENMGNLLTFQISSLKSYFDISINQLRAAAEIKDLKSLQYFYIRQAEIAQILQRKFLNDARILSDFGLRCKSEMDSLTQATLEESWPKAA